jgi:hypothetical protein
MNASGAASVDGGVERGAILELLPDIAGDLLHQKGDKRPIVGATALRAPSRQHLENCWASWLSRRASRAIKRERTST